MIKNYFISALRSMRRNLSFTFLNVFGLSLSILSCLIIFLIVRYELGYDSFSKKADRTYRITLNALDFNANISMAVVPALRNDFPQLENITQIFYQRDGQVQIGQNRFIEKNFAFVDSQFTKIFDYKWISGDPTTALYEPNSVVLTETTAHKYFGDKQAMGEIINLGNEFTVKVTGIIKDPPANTSLPFKFLVSLNTRKFNEGMMREFYAIPGFSYAYLVIPENYSIHDLEKQVPAFLTKHWGKNIAEEAHLPFQPLREVHFDQRYINNIITPISKRYLFWTGCHCSFYHRNGLYQFYKSVNCTIRKTFKRSGSQESNGCEQTPIGSAISGRDGLLVLISVLLDW